MSKMVDTLTEGLEELKNNGTCRFHKAYVGPEWAKHYAPRIKAIHPEAWWHVNSNNHIVVKTTK